MYRKILNKNPGVIEARKNFSWIYFRGGLIYVGAYIRKTF